MRKLAVWIACLLVTSLAAIAGADPGGADAPSNATPPNATPPNATPGKADQPPAKEGRIEVAGSSGAESVAAKELTTTIEKDKFEYLINVVEVGRIDVGEVGLAVEPFSDDAGKQYPLEWRVGELKGGAFTVIAKPMVALARRTVDFSATLPALGTYSAVVTPYWGGAAHQKLLLKVTRRRPTLALSVSEPSAFAQDGDTSATSFVLTLQETAGNALKMQRPTLASLVESQGSGATAVSLARTAQLDVLLDGKPLNGNAGINFSASESKSPEFRLAPLPGPGKYEAKVRFTTEGALPIEKSVTLYVRSCSYIAFGLIALGVLVSFALKYWASKEQPRVAELERAGELGVELQAALRAPDLDDMERKLGDATREKLARLLSGISGGSAGADTAAVDRMVVLVSVVRNWIVVHRSVRQVPSELVRQEFFAKLAPIRDDALGDGADIAKLQEHQATLRAFPTQLEAAVRKEGLLVELAKTKQECDASSAAAFDAEVRAMLDAGKLDAAAARLRQEQDAIVQARVAKRAQAGGTMGAEEVATTRAALQLNPFAGFNTPVLEEALRLTQQRVQRARFTEVLINGFIVFIAVVLGMKALYIDDLVWGGWSSCVTAFLWGLGLHQFSYGGVGSVLDKLAKPGTAT